MATRYQYYDTEEGNTAYYFITKNWRGQTFTPTISHKITEVKLDLRRKGLPGIITISIRATSGGLPIGDDLASGTFDGDTLSVGFHPWITIPLSSALQLTAETMYAIIMRIAGGDIDNCVDFWVDAISPMYTRGSFVSSSNSGVDWAADTSIDIMFEEWGDPLLIAPTVTTNPASALSAIAATLNGTLNQDGGEACECGFEWGLDIGYGVTTPPQSKTTGETFSQVIGGLIPNTVYHFRAFATNSVGTDHGDDRTFTTALVISRAHALAREEL